MHLDQQQLLESSNYITTILSQLKSNLISNGDDGDHMSGESDEIEINIVQFISKAIDLRTAFRVLVDGIQTNRALVQIQKQQIEKKKMYLQGLHYYKATLKSQITNSQLDLVDLNDYMNQQEQQINQDRIINWIDDYEIEEERLVKTMETFRLRKQEIRVKQQRKQELHTKLTHSQQTATKSLPTQLKKLHSQLLQTTKLFNIRQLDTITLTEFKNKHIQRIHSILFPLKVKEMIDLKHTIIGEYEEEELEITIEKGWCGEWYEYARRNKIGVEDRQFKFTISSLTNNIKNDSRDTQPHTLVISISRRQQFTVHQIFNNLLLQQSVKPIYQTPLSEMQINTNIKYVKLNWITDVLGSSSCIISGKMFIDRVKERIFALTLVKYALENVTKKTPCYFFPLFQANEQGSKLTTFTMLENKKYLIRFNLIYRIMFTKCQKSQFEEYKQQVYIPQWVLKALNNQQILTQSLKSPKTNNQQPSISLTQKKLLSSFIQSNHLEDLEENNTYEYYRFEIVAQKSLLTGFLIIPTDYPKKKSVVKLISFKKTPQSHPNLHVPKHTQITKTEKHEDDETRIFTEQLKAIQLQLNDKINVFFLPPVSSTSQLSIEEKRKRQPFFIYFQINRLISLLVEKSLTKN